MTPNSFVLRGPGGLSELRLQGRFAHPHWVAFLFAGLAQLQVAVISGKAVQGEQQVWDARLQLDFSSSTAIPETVDYVSLAQTRPVLDMVVPRLTRFDITRLPHALEVRLDGPDQIGFLGRLLNRMALLALFPMEIEIDTVAGRIKDRIVVQGIGGVAPDETVRESLQTLLRGLITAS